MTYQIEERFRQLTEGDSGSPLQIPRRPEFRDPLLCSFQEVALSRVIDRELDRFYNRTGRVDRISQIFRKFRRKN